MQNNVPDASLVSVIIPCYNQAEYIRQAVLSALDQTYPNIEVIVVDDGSQDNSREVLAGLEADPRVVLHNQPNQGSAAARNSGIKLAHGDYFLFLDGDDWLVPTALERLVEPLEAAKSVGLAYCDHYLFYEETSKAVEVAVNSFGSLENHSLDIIWSQCPFPLLSVLLRREWVAKVDNFNPDLPWMEDYDFWLKLSLAGCPMRYVPLTLGYYRQHPHSKTRRHTPVIIDEYFFKVRHPYSQKYPERTLHATSRAFQNLYTIIEKERWDNQHLRLEVEAAKEQYKLVYNAFKEAETYALSLEKALGKQRQNHGEAEAYAFSLEKELALQKQIQKETAAYALSLEQKLAGKAV